MQLVTLTARDGRQLAATLFAAARPEGAVLIASAMGVPRRFYNGLARFFAEGGLTALSLDYRGIGDSRLPGGVRAENASLHEWGELDLAAGVQWLRTNVDAPLAWFGHSVGGQLMGLLPADAVERAVFVASQSGYWKFWPSLGGKSAIFGLWHAAIPLLTLSGKLPMRALGQGEDVPKNVAREWAQWGRHPRYIGRYADRLADCAFKSYRGPLTAYAIADDYYAPPATARELLGLYQHAQTSLSVIEPASLGVERVGHFGIFRPHFREQVWHGWRERLLGHAA